jgi:hypothetical protein
MAARDNFASFAAFYDEALRAGADAAVNAGLAEMRELFPFFMVPMVSVWGILLWRGLITVQRLQSYGMRVAVFMWLAIGAAYVPHVRDLVVDAIPNRIASAVNGGGSPITSAQQFDVLDEATAHFASQIRANATCFTCLGNRVSADMAEGWAKLWLAVIFYMWIAVRQITYLLVAAGAFMLIFLIPESTRSWPMQMFSKFVGVSVWQLMTSILLAMSMAGMQSHLRDAISNPGMSIDEQLQNLKDVGGWFLGVFFLLLVVPALSGFGAGHAAGVAQGTVMGTLGMAGRFAASAGGAAGRQTASTLRSIARNTAQKAGKA